MLTEGKERLSWYVRGGRLHEEEESEEASEEERRSKRTAGLAGGNLLCESDRIWAAVKRRQPTDRS